MNLTNIKVSIFKDLKSYESRPVGLQEVLWYLQNDRDVENKTALYRNLAKDWLSVTLTMWRAIRWTR